MKTASRLYSILLMVSIIFSCIGAVPVKATGDAVKVVYSYDGETEAATVGTTQGTHSRVKVDDEHGFSMCVNSAPGSVRMNFLYEEAQGNPLMELMSFEVYCDRNDIRAYTELIADDDPDKDYYDRFKRLYYIQESQKTTIFGNFQAREYTTKWDRAAKHWYKMDVCADYINRKFIYYIDGVQVATLSMEEDMNGFLGMRYVSENINGGGIHYLDNIKCIQVLKRGVKLGLDDMCYPSYIEDELSISVNSNTLGSIFFDLNAQFDLVLENFSDYTAQFEISAAVKSENGDVGETEVSSAAVKTSEKTVVKLNPEVSHYGFNTLIVDITNKDTGEKYRVEKEFSTAHAPADGVTNPKVAFGDNTASHDPVNGSSAYGYEREKIELFKKAGFSATRYGIYWNYCEREQGNINLDLGNHSLVKQILAENDMELINLLYSGNKGNEAWGVEAAPKNAFGREKFAEYAYESTKAALGVSNRVEVWNEYNLDAFNPSGATVDDYIELLKVTYAAVKKANPDAKVYGLGGVTYVSNLYEWIEEFLQKGGHNYCDGFTFHPYATSYPASESISVFEKCWELFEKYNATDKDIILSEIGWHSNNITEMTQASYEIQFAASVYDRVETISWWCAQEQQGTSDGENKFGMIRAWDEEWCAPYEPFSAKPKFLAHTNFNRIMTGAEGTDSKKLYDTVQLKSFKDKAGRSVSIVWNTQEKSKNIALKVDTEKVTVSDIYGNETEIAAINGVVNLVVGNEPIYVMGSYSAIEEAQSSCKINTNLIETTVDDKSSVVITKSFSDDAIVEVKTPSNITVVENNGFNSKNIARLVFDIGSVKADTEVIEIYVKSSDGRKTYYKDSVTVQYQDTVSTTVLADYFRSNRWQGSVKIKNNKQSKSVSGMIKITKPEYLADITSEIRFDYIGAMQTKELTFNIPETLQDVKTVVEMDVNLDNGETFKIASDVYFTAFIKTKNPPVIDGYINDGEWNKAAPFKLKYENQVYSIPDWNGPLDVGGEVYFQWDNNNLYMAAEIDDDVHFVNDDENRIWYTDSIQIAVAESNEVGTPRTEFGFGMLNGELSSERYSFMAVDTGIIGVTDKQNFKNDVKMAIKRDEDKKKTYYEVLIPWYHLYGKEIKPGLKDCLYFSMLINDNDGDSRGWIEFCPGIGQRKDVTAFIKVPIEN